MGATISTVKTRARGTVALVICTKYARSQSGNRCIGLPLYHPFHGPAVPRFYACQATTCRWYGAGIQRPHAHRPESRTTWIETLRRRYRPGRSLSAVTIVVNRLLLIGLQVRCKQSHWGGDGRPSRVKRVSAVCTAVGESIGWSKVRTYVVRVRGSRQGCRGYDQLRTDQLRRWILVPAFCVEL
ncbi:hypothetical protein F4861DRAFT_26863 [Xylaria intraflava]|nr:hypothetical protein F4861DRAFT_26863 [Xylaria intraflava]